MNSEAETLTNQEVLFQLNGKDFRFKRASLKQVIAWQKKVKEITADNDGSGDLKMVAYALYLSLSTVDTSISESWIEENTPGDIDVVETLQKLGFMSQKKVGQIRPNQNSLAEKKPSGE